MEKWEYTAYSFDASEYPMTKVRSIYSDGKVIAHVNCAFGDGEENAKKIAAVPNMLTLLKTIAGMETEEEINERTDDEGMSGDDACATLSSLIASARVLVAKAGVK